MYQSTDPNPNPNPDQLMCEDEKFTMEVTSKMESAVLVANCRKMLQICKTGIYDLFSSATKKP
jgi:hypothetical protein